MLIIEKLQNKLHTQIPLTKLMNINIKNILIGTAPLNINDKSTAFGGSLSTLTIISSGSMCYLILEELNIISKNIVVIKNETKYL